MTKVRLRKAPQRPPPPRVATRGEMSARQKEDEIVRIYRQAGKGGSKLIEAHGALSITNVNYKTVPADTVIIFLSKFGQCMSLQGQRTLSNEYFTSDAGMIRFFRGEAGMAGVHHGEILSRTKFPEQKYPDVELGFYDEKWPSFGWVWSLPIGRKRAENFSSNWPSLNQVIRPNIHGKNMRLSDVIEGLGKGVYIISACLVSQNQIEPMNKIPFNLPQPWKPVPARRTRTAAAFAGNIFKKQPLRPGSFAHRTFYRKTGGVYKGVPRIRVAEVLTQLSRRPNRVNLKSKFPLMRANVNTDRLLRIQKILQNPTNFVSKLSPVNRNAWTKLSAVNRGAFVNKHMNLTPVYYFRRTHPLTKQEVWFNNSGRMNNKPANLHNRPIPPDNWTNNNWRAFENSPLQRINMNNDPNTNFNWHIFKAAASSATRPA